MAEDVAMSDVKAEVKPEKGEDTVVAELDVFISQTLAQQLYLLQYPLRPPWRPYDPTQMAGAKFKPKQQRLQMEYSIDTKSAHYDPDSPLKTPAQVLNSTRIDSRTTYCVAALRGSELHLTPIHGGILQLRPSFAHLDAADAEKKKTEEEDVAPVHEEEDVDDDAPIAKPLTVQFKRRENERSAVARKQSHAFLRQLEEEEPWTELKRHLRDSPEGSRTFERLFCTSDAPVTFNMSAEEYISRLMPATPAEVAPAAPAGSVVEEPFSLAQLRRLPLDQQLKSLFQSVCVLQYARVKELATAARSDDELLSALGHIAVLVRSVWVGRSELFYMNDARLMRAHDHLLLTLHEKASVTNRKEFAEKVGLPVEEASKLISRVAKLEPGPGWVLKVAPDPSFAAAFPMVVSSYEQSWADKKRHQPVEVDVERGRPAETEPMQISGPGATLQEQLCVFLKELFTAYGVCSQPFIKQQLELLRKNDTHPYSLLKEAKSIDSDLFNRTLKSVAGALHNAFYLRSTGDATHDKYRETILAVFKDKVAIKKAEVAKAVEDLKLPAIPNAACMKVLKEFATAKGNQWIFKSGNNDQ